MPSPAPSSACRRPACAAGGGRALGPGAGRALLRGARRRLADRLRRRRPPAGRGGLPHGRRAHRFAGAAPQAAPGLAGDGLARLGVEVYGGPILASFADRDLSLAGRVMLRTARREPRRACCASTAAAAPAQPGDPHEPRGQRSRAQVRQADRTAAAARPARRGRRARGAPACELLAAAAQCDAAELLSWELAAYDVQPGSLWGADGEFIASRQLDNLASCHAACRR
jgi:hypothetical protein